MYIMCVCLFSALSRRVGALQISIIIIIIIIIIIYNLYSHLHYLLSRMIFDFKGVDLCDYVMRWL